MADLSGSERELFAACTAALARHGAEVILREGGDANWIRQRSPAEGGGFEVVVAGLPNLLHELAHAAQVGILADDHGFDYTRIPLELGRPADRQALWEELAAAVIACAYLPELGRPAAQIEAEVDAWFAEQIEIQGVFYGLQDEDIAGLVELLDPVIRGDGGAGEAVLERAYAEVAAWIAAAGAPAKILTPRRRYRLQELWRRYKARSPAEPQRNPGSRAGVEGGS